MGRRLAFLPVVMVAAGCASPWPPPRSREAAPLYRLAAEGTVPSPLRPAPGTAGKVISIEVRVEAPDGQTVVAPRIAAYAGQRANVQVVNQLSYIRDFDVEIEKDAFIADPVIGVAQEGVALDMTPVPSPGGRRTTLAYELRTARLHRPVDVFPAKGLAGNPMTIQLPSFDRAEAAGVRPVEHGVWSLLARLPDGKGSAVSVLVRVEPIEMEPDEEPVGEEINIASEDAPADSVRTGDLLVSHGDSLPARAARGALPAADPGLLELRGVVLRTEFPAGSVVEAAAASKALEDSVPLDPADLRVATGLVPGARVSCQLQEAYLKDYEIKTDGGFATADPEVGVQLSGLRADVEDGGSLRLTWTSTTAWDTATWSPTDDHRRLAVEVPSTSVRQARVVPADATRLVVLSRLRDGRSAGVLVRFRPEGDSAPR